jgi:hypothetical protein
LAKKFSPSTFIQGQFVPRNQFESEIFNSFICFLLFAFGSANRKSIELRAIDRSSKDDKYFRIREVNQTRIEIVLKESLDELVDNDTPHNILKFKIQCNSAVQSNRRNHDVRL